MDQSNIQSRRAARSGSNHAAIKKHGLFHNLLRYRTLYLMFLPTAVFLIIFNYIPMWGVVLAFKNYIPWLGFNESEWVGFDNFRYVFSTPDFPRLIRNTLLINIYKIIWTFPAPILLALMLNEVRARRFKNVVQTISYLPHFISWIVVSGIMYNLLNYNFGILNNIIKGFGGDPVQWYIRKDLWRGILVATSMWKSVGYSSIIYLAAISGIDQELYEAAVVDGANRWHQTRYITIPCLMPTVSVMFILGIGGIMYGDFGQIYALIGYNSSLFPTTDVLDFFIYRVGLQGGKFSVGTALGLFQSLIGFFMVLLTNKGAKKLGGQGIW